MYKGGRPKDPIWELFQIIGDGSNKKAQCKNCLHVMSKKADRMKISCFHCMQVLETETTIYVIIPSISHLAYRL